MDLKEVKSEIKKLEKELKETSDYNEQWKICHQLMDLYKQEYELSQK